LATKKVNPFKNYVPSVISQESGRRCHRREQKSIQRSEGEEQTKGKGRKEGLNEKKYGIFGNMFGRSGTCFRLCEYADGGQVERSALQ
jgi:hypothetical protein